MRHPKKRKLDVSMFRSPEAFFAALRNSRRAVSLVFGAHRGYAFTSVFMRATSAALAVGIAYVARLIVDAVERGAEQHDPNAVPQALAYVALELVLVVASAVAGNIGGVTSTLSEAIFSQRMNERVLETLMRIDLAELEGPETAGKLFRAQRDATNVPPNHVANILRLGSATLTVFGLGALLDVLSPWAAVAMFAAVIPSFAIDLYFQGEAFRLLSWASPDLHKQHYIETLFSNAEAAKELRLFELGEHFLAKHRAIFELHFANDRRAAVRRALVSLGVTQMSTLVFYGLYAYVAYRAATGAVTLADMTMVLIAFREGQSILRSSLGAFAAITGDVPRLETLFELLDHAPSLPDGDIERGPQPNDGFRFEGVGFSYPDGEKATLHDVSFHLPPRAKLALVGENGAGKTTLIKLLTRLYRPTEGRILLDGAPLDAWKASALRARIGVIFQDFVQYEMTLGENIGVGDVRALDDRARWAEAADRGEASAIVKDLPQGFDTQLGHWFDEGRELSLGQWQKVALSRAFMRRDADIVVLDEPTASMDAEAEARIFGRFRALTENRTAVFISHRFGSVRMADTIAVLEGGTIVELGSHDELMRREGGTYARLFTLQAQGYR